MCMTLRVGPAKGSRVGVGEGEQPYNTTVICRGSIGQLQPLKHRTPPYHPPSPELPLMALDTPVSTHLTHTAQNTPSPPSSTLYTPVSLQLTSDTPAPPPPTPETFPWHHLSYLHPLVTYLTSNALNPSTSAPSTLHLSPISSTHCPPPTCLA